MSGRSDMLIVTAPVSPAGIPLGASARTNVGRYHAGLLSGAAFPLVAGAIVFGWRALLAVGLVVAGAVAGAVVWRRVGIRGGSLSFAHITWSAVLLAMLLPAHLAGRPAVGGVEMPIWILPAAGMVLTIFIWLFGGIGAGRVPPVIVAFLLVWTLFAPAMPSERILQRDRLLIGDLLSASRPPLAPTAFGVEPWVQAAPPGGEADAQWIDSPAGNLQQLMLNPAGDPLRLTSLGLFLRDRLPPLEDLMIAGQPTPIGLEIAVAIIVGGLYLVYRGLLDHRIPLAILAAAYLVLLVLPLPVAGEHGIRYAWLPILREPIRPEAVLTFVHYELMASPLLFLSVFIATSTPLGPVGRTVRLIYAVALGAASAVGQCFLSMHWGPAAAMILVCLFTPYLDKWSRPRTLV